MKVLFVFGTRPEAIKLAPVLRALSAQPNFCCKICVTGQHREMLAQVLELFDLRPDWDLQLMRPNQDLAYITGAALSGVSSVLDSFRPDRVIVQGDTTTTFAGALAAFYHRIPVAHIEAGLRTDNIYAPWPEEVNRRLVTHIADLHFAPTARARDNLRREGIGCERILVTGNTGIDALLWVSALLDDRHELRSRFEAALDAFRGQTINPDDRPSPRKLRWRARANWRRNGPHCGAIGCCHRLSGAPKSKRPAGI
jgi:UDP-N-acetylglucosamine 2-epimerase (non-hydrolysing)